MDGFIVIEMQTNSEGETALLTFQKATRAEADSQYYTILAAAAISQVPVHSAVMLTKDGGFVTSKAYDHRQTVEAEA